MVCVCDWYCELIIVLLLNAYNWQIFEWWSTHPVWEIQTSTNSTHTSQTKFRLKNMPCLPACVQLALSKRMPNFMNEFSYQERALYGVSLGIVCAHFLPAARTAYTGSNAYEHTTRIQYVQYVLTWRTQSWITRRGAHHASTNGHWLRVYFVYSRREYLWVSVCVFTTVIERIIKGMHTHTRCQFTIHQWIALLDILVYTLLAFECVCVCVVWSLTLRPQRFFNLQQYEKHKHPLTKPYLNVKRQIERNRRKSERKTNRVCFVHNKRKSGGPNVKNGRIIYFNFCCLISIKKNIYNNFN